MYKKGLIREERMNREDIVVVSPVTIELIIHPILGRIHRLYRFPFFTTFPAREFSHNSYSASVSGISIETIFLLKIDHLVSNISFCLVS